MVEVVWEYSIKSPLIKIFPTKTKPKAHSNSLEKFQLRFNSNSQWTNHSIFKNFCTTKSKHHGTKPMHPSSLRAFQRHKEQDLKHPSWEQFPAFHPSIHPSIHGDASIHECWFIMASPNNSTAISQAAWEHLVDGCTFACSAFWFGSKWPIIKKKKSWHAKVHPSTLPGNAF